MSKAVSDCERRPGEEFPCDARTAEDMGESSLVPAGHPECRRNGENNPEFSSSSKMGWGGARPNSGGARPNSGGARPNSGGARPNAGGARPGAGRRRLTVNPAPPPRDPAGCWLCAEARPGREEILAEQLRRLGFETWVVIGELPREEGAKGPAPEGPLFPGYVFLRFGPDTLSLVGDRWNETLERPVSVLDAPELLGIVRHANGSPWPMLPADVDRLLARMVDGVIPRPDAPDDSFAPGDLVCVADGPFTSFPGVVRSVGRVLVVEVTVFGRPTPMELLPEAVEMVTPAPRG